MSMANRTQWTAASALALASLLILPPPARADILAELEDPNAVIAWVGAHPDDEIFVAPLLGHLCKGHEDKCRMLTVTNGATGPCHLDSCDTEEETKEVRAREQEEVAAYLEADLTHWSDIRPSGITTPVAAIRQEWTAQQRTLLDDMIAFLDGANRLLIFDSRHGSTCHNEHKATALLALDAADHLGLAHEKIYLAQAVYDPGIYCRGERPRLHWHGYRPAVPDDPAVESFDAHGADAWRHLTRTVELYPSQFLYPVHYDNLRTGTPAQRIVPLLRYTDVQPGSGYEQVCPVSCVP